MSDDGNWGRKPRLVRLFEEWSGDTIDRPEWMPPITPSEDRHLSIRLPRALYRELELMANSRGVTVSAFVRGLVQDAVAADVPPDRADLDAAIETLQRLRDHFPKAG